MQLYDDHMDERNGRTVVLTVVAFLWQALVRQGKYRRGMYRRSLAVLATSMN